MKRLFFLSLSLLFSVSVFAQIRIEKRHYNKGWYVSRSHSVKTHADTSRSAKAIAHAPAKTTATSSALNNEISRLEIITPDSPVQTAKPVPVVKPKPFAAKKAAQPAAMNTAAIEKINTAVVHSKESFARETKTHQTQNADPGDSFWVYLFDTLRPLFIAFGVIILLCLAAIIIYGLITNPISTILGLAILFFCPEIFLLS